MIFVSERFQLAHLIVDNHTNRTSLWRGLDRASGAAVAIKLLRPGSPALAARFRREAEVMRAISHPAVVKLIDAGELADGCCYLATEWLVGGDLAQLTTGGPLGFAEVLALGGRVAGALAAIHRDGVVHRDVKPSNIFLRDCDPAAATLIDFGVAHRADALHETALGSVVGTPAYMAPEQCRGEAVDARTDLFALGVVLYEAVTGRRLFAASTPTAALARVLHEPTPTLTAAPTALAELLAALLQKDPRDRPASAVDVAAALTELAREADRATQPDDDEHQLTSLVAVRAAVPELVGIAAAATAHQATRWTIDDGTLVATFSQLEPARDLCRRSAGLALLALASAPAAQIVVLTGRRGHGDRRIDARGIAGASSTAPGQIQIDPLTRGLLDDRFEVDSSDHALILRGQRHGAAPQVLGRDSPCVGRDADLRQLTTGYAQMIEQEQPRAALVLAVAGGGKSRLAYELRMRLLDAPTSPSIWTGFADLGASEVPFALIENLLRGHLGVARDAPEATVRAQIEHAVSIATQPDDRARVADGLAALLRVDADRRPAWEDPAIILDRAATALTTYASGLAARRPLVLLLDDLHWADRPSLALVERMLSTMASGHLYVVGFARPEGLERFPGLWGGRAVSILRLPPLSRRAAERMVMAALGDLRPRVLDQIIDVAEGNPFFLEELIRGFSRRRHDDDASDITLPETVVASVQSRLQAFAADERLVLRAASVFGQVFWRSGVLATLATLAPSGEAPLDGARSDDTLVRLIRLEVVEEVSQSRYTSDREYRFRHALLREGAYAMLTARDRELGHHAAGTWLEATVGTDATVTAAHYLAAGRTADAARAVLAAARLARQQIGYQHVADLCAQVLGRDDVAPETRQRLLLAQAEALAAAGAGAQAAQVFLSAARDATEEIAIDLRRRAAEAYLRSGHVVEGMAVMTQVLRAIGVRLPATNLEALATVAANRARLFVRGTGFVPRAVARTSAEDRLAVDTCESVGTSVALIDYVRAAALQSRAALRALDLGEPVRVARAITYEACFQSARSFDDSQRLLRRAQAMAADLGDDRLDVVVAAAGAVTNFFGARYLDVLTACARTRQRYQATNVGGLSWEMTTTLLVELWSRGWLDDRDELRRQVPGAIQAAEARGDRFALVYLQTGPLVRTWLGHESTSQLHRRIDLAIDAWPTRDFFLPHYYVLIGHVLVDLEVGDGRQARSRLATGRAAIQRAQLHRVRQFAATLDYLEARALAAIGGPDAERERQRHHRRLQRSPLPWARQLANQLASGDAMSAPPMI